MVIMMRRSGCCITDTPLGFFVEYVENPIDNKTLRYFITSIDAHPAAKRRLARNALHSAL
jgi:hypothetical protein